MMVKQTGIALFSMILLSTGAMAQAKNNTLTAPEKSEGWQLLFDGSSTKGWHNYNKQAIGPEWKADDGSLHLDASHKSGSDIVSTDKFENFDLKLQWKISKGGNSGILFLVNESPKYEESYFTGPEMQVLDNDGHPDGKIHKHRAGDLYDLIASSTEPVHAVGDWNDVEIKLNHGKLDFYLNGVHTVSTTMWDANWDNLVKGSKFAKMTGFAKSKSGHIDLQYHGFDVWFRNIKIKKL
ncbi:MAG TPA: DUF1080 domain-containing protein [Puia sp.]